MDVMLSLWLREITRFGRVGYARFFRRSDDHSVTGRGS